MDDAHLTPEERELLRDFDAYAWGSFDVSGEDVLRRGTERTPEGLARVGAVLMERVRASRERQRRHEHDIETLQRLMDRLEP